MTTAINPESVKQLQFRFMLKSKIHRATVSGSDLNYAGSLTLGPGLIAAADLYENERVEVVNLNNGHRFSTYVLGGNQSDCRLNGAAARLGVA